MLRDAGIPTPALSDQPPVFRVLGTFDIHHDGAVHAVTAGRSRIVLAMLLLEPRRILSVDRLVQAVWQDSPPPTARGQIQICVSALRKQFAKLGLGDLIQTRTPGYLLDVEPEQIDLHRFELQAEEGLRAAALDRPEAASEILSDALALWRGPALPGIDGELVSTAAAGLADRRLAVFQAYAELELHRGNAGTILGQLAGFTAEHPMIEGLIGLQMAALFNSGRQAEALEVYRDARRRLVAELAVEPGQELRELERAILRGDLSHRLLRVTPAPAVARPADLSFELPAGLADHALIGRHAELDQLLDRLDHQRPPVAVLTGLAGSGKTRLAAECVLRWDRPYRYLDVGSLSDAAVAVQILLALGVPDERGDRWAACRAALAATPVLLVLDGLREQAVLDRLLPPDDAAGALLVVSPVPLALPTGAEAVQLSALSPDQSLAMLAANAGQDRVELHLASALQLIEATAGHPGVLAAYATELDLQPGLSLSDLAADARSRSSLLGDELTAGLVANCAQLDSDARMLLRRLAILPAGGFAGWVVAPLLDRSEARARPPLDELVLAGLVERQGRRFELPRPVRDFAGQLLAEEEGPAATAAAERRLLTATLARLATVRRPVGELPLRAALSTASGGESLDRSWLNLNAGLVRVAVRRAAELGCDELCWQLGFVIAGLLDPDTVPILGDDLIRLASAAAVRADDRRGQAAMLQVSARSRLQSGDTDGARAQLQVAIELFEELGDEAAGWHLRRSLAELQLSAGEPAVAVAGLRQCIGGFAQLGDPGNEALSLLVLIRALRAGEPAAAELCSRRLGKLLDTVTDSRLRRHIDTELQTLPPGSEPLQPPERTWA